MPLNIAPQGKTVKVIKVIAEDKIKKHLENLGIFPGVYLILLFETGGNIILKVQESRLAINRQLAMKILVN